MNTLSEKIAKITNGDTLVLEKGAVYPIAPEDGFHIKGLYFSNTAKKEENPEGERFAGIYLENKKNVVIDGNGSALLIHGIMTPFIFKNCKNITLKNFSIDHFRPTMSEFTVTESEKGKATLLINDEFFYRIEDNRIIWVSDNNKSGKPYWELPYKGPKVLTNAFDPETELIDDMICGEGDSYRGFPDIDRIVEVEKGVLKIAFRDKNKIIKNGTVAQTRCIKRIQTGGAIDGCENITLENLRIYSMNGFGILAQNSKDITYIGLTCTPKEGRTIVSDADFFHFSGCSGKVSVQNCKAKGAHDDIINIHGTHLKIIKMNRTDNRVLLRYSHPESWGFQPYEKKDEIEFISGNTLIPYFHTEVLCVNKLNDTDFLVTVAELPTKEPEENDVIENITHTAELLVENCEFERIPSRAILCTTRKEVIIKNTLFKNMGAPMLCVADDANFWFESGRSGQITLENNEVYNVGAREHSLGCDVIRYEPVVMDKTSKSPVHKKLIVKNNRFINTLCNLYTINLNYLENAEFSNNTCNVKLQYKCDSVSKYSLLDEREGQNA